MIQKDYSISATRYVAMCFIILCHIMQYYNFVLAWWFNVGVQIFLIISGYLYGSKEINAPIKWIGKQFKKILIPYYIFITIACICYYITGNGVSIVDYIKTIFCLYTIKGIGHLWFIKYILFCYILTPYLYELKKWLREKGKRKSLFYFAIIFVVYNIVSLPVYSYINTIWIDCYILGFFLNFYTQIIKEQAIKHFKFIIITIGIILNILRAYVTYSNNYSRLTSKEYFPIVESVCHLMLGFTLFFIFSYCFKNVQKCKLLVVSDNYSYHIYIVHQLFILSPLSFMALTEFTSLNLIVVLAAIILSGLLLKHIENKITQIRLHLFSITK